MTISTNKIALRPRFQLDLDCSKEEALKAFEVPQDDTFIRSRSDDHIFIRFNSRHSHFWSPQLHLEINELENGSSRLYGLYGPNPTLWTFFIFLHFGVATLFAIFVIWAYSYATLGRSFMPQLVAMILLIVIWFVLYAFGRAGRRKGKPQMEELHRLMMQVTNRLLISDDTQNA